MLNYVSKIKSIVHRMESDVLEKWHIRNNIVDSGSLLHFKKKFTAAALFKGKRYHDIFQTV